MNTSKISRRPLIAGNWKMNLDLKGSAALARALVDGLGKPFEGPEIMVAPPFTALAAAGSALKGGPVRLGAQDVFWEEKGAFTGEVSAAQLKDAGCTHVIIGHSERRQHFGETDETVGRRLKAALKAALAPVVCVGETLAERESQKTYRVLETQLSGALKGFSYAELAPLVIAYEPVWAIGTGKTATPAQAQDAHVFIRRTVANLLGQPFADSLRILYGGSVTADNVDSLMAQPDVDGALVGGASLKPDSFLRIIRFQAPVNR
ncbi:MAG: triose-phosphate isomerase [Elusimicrobia bacterium]|nr:triose-phosphate isomerase [Elusimicrobiota bacterium]